MVSVGFQQATCLGISTGARRQELGRADAIRDQLRDMGLAIEDTAAGSRIKHVK